MQSWKLEINSAWETIRENIKIVFLWGASCCIILSNFPNIPAIATETLVTLFQSIHNMFRPLQVNTISLTLFEVLSMLQRICCSLIVTYWCESSNIYLQSEF
jgi:hypothetical protein